LQQTGRWTNTGEFLADAASNEPESGNLIMRTIEDITLDSVGCCECDSHTNGEAATKPSLGRYGKFLRWFVPGVALAVMPKCPACFAMYFAAATGIGVAFSTAASLRIIFMLTCVAFPIVATFWPTLQSLYRRFLNRHTAARRLVVR
jgi:hypothetical protein